MAAIKNGITIAITVQAQMLQKPICRDNPNANFRL